MECTCIGSSTIMRISLNRTFVRDTLLFYNLMLQCSAFAGSAIGGPKSPQSVGWNLRNQWIEVPAMANEQKAQIL